MCCFNFGRCCCRCCCRRCCGNQNGTNGNNGNNGGYWDPCAGVRRRAYREGYQEGYNDALWGRSRGAENTDSCGCSS